MNWYAIHSQAQKESLAARELRRVGFETFWPHTTAWVGTGHKAKSRLVRRSWLSRYLFVRTTQDQLGEVNRSPGVSTVVFAPGGDPYPVHDEIMQVLLDCCDHLGEVHIVPVNKKRDRLRARPGAILQFKEQSPLFGFFGELIQVMDNGRLLVLFKEKLFGSDGRDMEVDQDDVEVIVA